MTIRTNMVTVERWGVAHSASMPYTENLDPSKGPTRSSWLSRPVGTLPLCTDCSGWSVYVLRAAGANISRLSGPGWVANTAVFLAVGQEIPPSAVEAGDFVVYGPGGGCHMAPIIAGGPDPLTATHGSNGVQLVPVSLGCPSEGYVNGRPVVRYVRIVPPDVAPLTPAQRLALALKARVTPNVGYCQHPLTGGQALVNQKARIYQGIPDHPTLAALIGDGLKRTTVPAGWWATAKQVAW